MSMPVLFVGVASAPVMGEPLDPNRRRAGAFGESPWVEACALGGGAEKQDVSEEDVGERRGVLAIEPSARVLRGRRARCHWEALTPTLSQRERESTH